MSLSVSSDAPGEVAPLGSTIGGGAHRNAAKSGDVVTAGLQELFASIADEQIPDEFLRLLDDIDASAARAMRVGKDGSA